MVESLTPTKTPGEAKLKARRMGIDTYQEAVIYMREDCHVCLSEGFVAQSRVRLHADSSTIIATLNVVSADLLPAGEVGLSEVAWAKLHISEGAEIQVSHPEPVKSFGYVRGKIFGERLDSQSAREIIHDVSVGRYSNVNLASFVTACAAQPLNLDEIVAITEAMIRSGDRITWDRSPVVDKHCVGGLPGNRTTLIVVPIITAFGLTMPKTSSRAITSPAGTADVMETLAPVSLSVDQMRSVVEAEGGCIAWGGAVRLSPADDILIRVERSLNIDAEGQLVASVLSKKVASGSDQVLIDVPVGPTAKVRDAASAEQLAETLTSVGERVGLEVEVQLSDGRQPVGRGIGPALEAWDILAVLQSKPEAPRDLRDRSLILAGRILEMSGEVGRGEGLVLATDFLDCGEAWKKFQSICEAQGGMREPPKADYTYTIASDGAGVVQVIDNRRLARAAKLAGAPNSSAAGIKLEVKLDTAVEIGQPMFTIHAESEGALDYSLNYVRQNPDIFQIESST